jgi:hypothetical protein
VRHDASVPAWTGRPNEVQNRIGLINGLVHGGNFIMDTMTAHTTYCSERHDTFNAVNNWRPFYLAMYTHTYKIDVDKAAWIGEFPPSLPDCPFPFPSPLFFLFFFFFFFFSFLFLRGNG